MTETHRVNTDIVIAGGGLVGLPLALALTGPAGSPTGVKIIVVDRQVPEQALNTNADGRAFALSQSSMQLLEVLGVWDAIKPHAQAVSEITITDSKLHQVMRPVFLRFDNETCPGEPASYIVESTRLKVALWDAVRDREAITVIAPETIIGFETDRFGVSVERENGPPLRATMLAAADGRQSALRGFAGIKTLNWTAKQWGIVATIAHELPHYGRATQHFMASGPFAILPLTGNRVSLVWSEEAETAKSVVQLDDDAFLREVQKRMARELGDIELAGSRGAFPLSLLVARDYVRERFCLVGDAAHGMHWIAGQGLNYGLRDVAALAEVVIDAHRLGMDYGHIDVLERYERWRRFDGFSFTAAMTALNTLFSNNNPVAKGARDFGLGVVNQLPQLKRLFVHEAAGITGDLPRLLRGEQI